MAEPSTSSSPLLELPPELRNTIYCLILIDGEPTELNANSITTPNCTALLQTCTQIRSEATALFLASNSFQISIKMDESSKITSAAKWLGSLPAEHTRKIKVITLLVYLLDAQRGEVDRCLEGLGQGGQGTSAELSARMKKISNMKGGFWECTNQLCDAILRLAGSGLTYGSIGITHSEPVGSGREAKLGEELQKMVCRSVGCKLDLRLRGGHHQEGWSGRISLAHTRGLCALIRWRRYSAWAVGRCIDTRLHVQASSREKSAAA